ncbi:Unknown protein, partial [Striga hermonthica]
TDAGHAVKKFTADRHLKQNGTHLRMSRKIRVNMGKSEKCIQRLKKDLFSNTTPLFDVDNIYLSPHRVLNQNGTRLRNSRKIRGNRGKNKKCNQRLRKDLFSNTAPLFDVDNVYLSPHRVLKQNGTRLRKSRKIRVNRGKNKKCNQHLQKDLFSNMTPLFDGLEFIFEVMDCPDRYRVVCAQLQLTGDARLWWNAYWSMRPGEKAGCTWDMLKELVREKCYPSYYQAEIERQFLALQQGTRTVDEYEREFTRVAAF